MIRNMLNKLITILGNFRIEAIVNSMAIFYFRGSINPFTSKEDKEQEKNFLLQEIKNKLLIHFKGGIMIAVLWKNYP
jgi:hypothetical protein